MSSDDLEQMKVLNLAVVAAFAGGVAGALIGASTMFAVDVLIPRTATADTLHLIGPGLYGGNSYQDSSDLLRR